MPARAEKASETGPKHNKRDALKPKTGAISRSICEIQDLSGEFVGGIELLLGDQGNTGDCRSPIAKEKMNSDWRILRKFTSDIQMALSDEVGF